MDQKWISNCILFYQFSSDNIFTLPQINKEPVMRDTPFKCLPHGAIGVSTSGKIWNAVNLLSNSNDV